VAWLHQIEPVQVVMDRLLHQTRQALAAMRPYVASA
jgi:hypothetical protein